MDNQQENNRNNAVDHSIYGVLVMFVVSIIVMVALSFTQKRTKMGLQTCNGAPGIVPPVNFLNPRHRIVYMLAFGVIGSQLTAYLVQSSGGFTGNIWVEPFLQPLYVTFAVLFLVIITYPILACVEAPIPIVGYVLGLMYTAIYLVYAVVLFGVSIKDVKNLLLPNKYKNVFYSSYVVSAFPQVFCLTGILFWYIYKLIKEIIRVSGEGGGWNRQSLEQPQSKMDFFYVNQLLKDNSVKNLKDKTLTSLRLPLPIMIAAVVAFIIIFQLTVLVCFGAPIAFDLIGLIFTNSTTKVASFSKSLSGLSVVSPVLSSILSCVLFVHFIYSMRQNMVEIRKNIGLRELVAKPIKWPALTVGSSVRYAGYQAAAIVTGWIVFTIVIFVVLLLGTLLFFIPSLFGQLYFRLVMIIFWVVLILVVQLAISKLFFVTSDSSELRTVILNNRRVFNLFSYIVFLYNVITGIMTAIVRVGLSFVFMVLILPRMDRVIFVKGFELFDLGHGMFKNFMLMELLLHNPIVHVFVMLVSRESSLPKAYSDSPLLNTYRDQNKTTPRSCKHQRVINRWLVAYTLVRNPSLKEFRKSNHSSTKSSPDLRTMSVANPLVSINNTENV